MARLLEAETATVESGETHRLLEFCKVSAADFAAGKRYCDES
jgi:hypothetical protein